MGRKWVQFKAMVRKDWMQMKAEKCKIVTEIIFIVGASALVGYELSNQLKNEQLMGVGYIILLLVFPIMF